MAWFKFGNKFGSKDGDKVRAKQAPVQSVETMRQRAKHRLIGTVVLVLAGVVGFPMLFDSQPRPVSVDVPIDIPDKTKVKPLASPPAAGPTAAPAARVDASASLGGTEEIMPPKVLAPKIEEKLAVAAANSAQAAPKSVATADSSSASGVAAAVAAAEAKAKKDDAKPPADDKAKADTVKADAAKAKAAEVAKEKEARAKEARDKQAKDKETARAKALLDGNDAKLAVSSATPTAPSATPPAPAPQAGADTRYIVQFGAFSDADKAQEVRRKVEKTGLKTYSQVTETAQGKRYRVRVGPFTTRDEADKAAAKIKALDLPASVLTL